MMDLFWEFEIYFRKIFSTAFIVSFELLLCCGRPSLPYCPGWVLLRDCIYSTSLLQRGSTKDSLSRKCKIWDGHHVKADCRMWELERICCYDCLVDHYSRTCQSILSVVHLWMHSHALDFIFFVHFGCMFEVIFSVRFYFFFHPFLSQFQMLQYFFVMFYVHKYSLCMSIFLEYCFFNIFLVSALVYVSQMNLMGNQIFEVKDFKNPYPIICSSYKKAIYL